MDDLQKAALELSRKFWDNREEFDEKRLCYLEVLCDRMDRYLHQKKDNTRSAILNRIVSASLMTTTGLSFDAGEFIVDLALDASLPKEKLCKILSRHIPEFTCTENYM